MFDIVRRNKTISQIVLALVTLPFVFFGVDSYVSGGGSTELVKIGDSVIQPQAFQDRMNLQQQRLQAQMGENADQSIFQSAYFRNSVLRDMINERLLTLYVHNQWLHLSDEALAKTITSDPGLQEEGKFSRELYDAVVAAQPYGRNSEEKRQYFEDQLRNQMKIQQGLFPVAAAVSGTVSADRWLAAQLEEREIREFYLLAEPREDAFTPSAPPRLQNSARFS